MNANESSPGKTASRVLLSLGTTALLGGCTMSNEPTQIRIVGKPVEVQEQLVMKPELPTTTVELLYQPATVQDAATEALARIGQPSLPALIQTLSAPEPRARAEAARALAMMGPTAAEAVPALVKLMNDPDLEVRTNAARALGQIGPAAEEAVPVLIDLLKKPTDPNPVPPESLPPTLAPGTTPATPVTPATPAKE